MSGITDMEFGVSLLGIAQQHKDVDMTACVDDVVSWTRACRDAGLDHVTTGHHYLLDPLQELQPVPLLARLIGESGSMKLAATLVAPLLNPVDLAETWASLDVLSSGRMILCLALGYRDVEYAAFGLERPARVRAMTEVVETVRDLWRGTPVTRTTDRFTLNEAICTIRPVQQPHPPMWIAANADAAIERAAAWGLDWNIPAALTFDEVERKIARYRAASPLERRDAPLPLARELFCARTREEAYALAGDHLLQRYAVRDQWRAEQSFSGEAADLATVGADRFIIGNPDDCSEQIARYAALGIDRFHFRMNWPGMPLETARYGLDTFADHVLPRFR